MSVSIPPRLNAHIHLPPNFSAFSSVAQAVALAQEQGITVLGASNYYDWSVYSEFARLAQESGIFPLFGLEIICLVPELQEAGIKINDPGNPGKFYLCGKGITQFSPLSSEAATLLEVIQTSDSARMAAMVDKLAALLSVSLTAESIRHELAARYKCPVETVFLQERHVAQAFEAALVGRADALDQNAIRSQLMKAGKPGYVPETFVGFDHAYQLILALGGIPTYPTLADGASPICPFEELERLVPELLSRGIYAAEVIPTRNAPEVLERYVTTLRSAGIIVTAGTEHNTPELSPLVPTCLNGVPVPEALEAIFWEGACVIAAHQHRTAQGKPGYVLSDGTLNPDAGIAGLAAFGATLLTVPSA